MSGDYLIPFRQQAVHLFLGQCLVRLFQLTFLILTHTQQMDFDILLFLGNVQ